MVYLFVLLIFALLYLISVYNSLQTLKVRIRAGIQEIGNQLKRQADLIPNLVSSTKGYLAHEKEIFDKLTTARKAIIGALESRDAQKMIESQELLGKALAGLRVVVESNPQIKASEVVSRLMAELRDTADKVMYSRRTLIDLVADFNQKLVVFPSSLVAKIFGFQKEEGLRVSREEEFLAVRAEETKTPEVKI